MVFLLPLFLHFAISGAEVVTDVDILMAKQTYGECRRDMSVDGNPLKIAGVQYDSGLGTHATSMIPVTVPSGATFFNGACGIDDEVSPEGSVRFQILSGSEVLWTSDVVKSGKLVSFSVSIPSGTRRIYLLCDEVEDNGYDHADWVNLAWQYGAQKRLKSGKKVFKASEFNIKANTDEDSGPYFRSLLSMAREYEMSSIFFERGVYHFYEDSALKFAFHVSNHDQTTFQTTSVPLVDLHGFTLDADGSTFIFHGNQQPLLVMDSTHVTIKNLKVDFARPYYTDGEITKLDYFSTTVKLNTSLFPFHVQNNALVFENEGFTVPAQGCYIYYPDSKQVVPNTGALDFDGAVTDNGDGTFTIAQNLKNKGADVGYGISIRSWGRPHPGIVVYRADDTLLDNFVVHDSQGMACLFQRSTNVEIKNCAVTYGSPQRYHSSSCDATHFSNVKGNIIVKNCTFEGMLDDAINVHSTSLKIQEIVNNTYLKLQYVHEQSVGFETFLPGEKIQFIHSSTLELSEVRTVLYVRKLSTTNIYVLLDSPIPSDIKEGDAVENGEYYPSVVFEGNTVRNNIARGCLFTTPKSVKCNNNIFDHTSGSAVLLAGDAANWYESGACTDVEIRGNKVIMALTSSYQFTYAIFSIVPTINDIANQKVLYHRNVKIEDNYIETYDVPLLYAMSTNTITFRNNEISYNSDVPSWNQKTFQFNKVSNVTIGQNTITPAKTWSMDDVKLENTDESEIHLE